VNDDISFFEGVHPVPNFLHTPLPSCNPINSVELLKDTLHTTGLSNTTAPCTVAPEPLGTGGGHVPSHFWN